MAQQRRKQFLVINREKPFAGVVGTAELRQYLRQGAFVLDFSQALENYRETVGADTFQTFDAKAIASFARIKPTTLEWWIREGVLPPSVAPRRGSGFERRWSYWDAFMGGLLGCLSRNGIPLEIIAEVGRVWSRQQQGGRKPADIERVEPAIVNGEPAAEVVST